MPATQQGQTFKQKTGWGSRWYDESGKRHQKGGFPTKSAATAYLREQTELVEAIRRGEILAPSRQPATLNTLLDLFLDKHGRTVDSSTKAKLTAQLRKARNEFGDRRPSTLRKPELEDWRESLPAGSKADVFRALRQALAWSTARGYTTHNPADGIKNPRRKRHERREVFPFETWDEVLAIAAELDEIYRAIPILTVGTGLRPEELFGLHKTDINTHEGYLSIERRYTKGQLKQGGKTPGSVRTIPLRQVVLDALANHPTAQDSPNLFAAPRGGYIDIEKFRYREWAPALRAAGLEHHRIYDMRHTFATWAIDNGIHLWNIATMMGTSVGQLEDTYARWLKRTDTKMRAAFDAYDLEATTTP